MIINGRFDKSDPEVQSFLGEALHAHAMGENAEVDCGSFSIDMRESKYDAPIAAVSGSWWGDAIRIDLLYVKWNHRKQGLATQLLRRVEERFLIKKGTFITVVTSQYECPQLYDDCGYTLEFFRRYENDPKRNMYYFIKRYEKLNKGED